MWFIGIVLIIIGIMKEDKRYSKVGIVLLLVDAFFFMLAVVLFLFYPAAWQSAM